MWRFGVRAFGVWVVAVGSLILVPSTASVAAEPLEMAPKYYSKQTRDGWQLSISIEGERINSVPNLAAATTSREGFVTLAATATAVGGATPITDSLFITGYQVGCQTDVSSGLGMGGSGAGGGNAGVGNTFINPVAASDSVGGAGGGAGFLQTTVQPGVIVEVPMATWPSHPTDEQCWTSTTSISRPTRVEATSPSGRMPTFVLRRPLRIPDSPSTAIRSESRNRR